MSPKRRTHSVSLKAKAALEAVSGYQTLNEIAGKYSVHPTQLSAWKKRLTSGAVELFNDKRRVDKDSNGVTVERLYAEIGRLKVELDWLKKKSEPLS